MHPLPRWTLPAFLSAALALALPATATGDGEEAVVCAPTGFMAEPIGVVIHLTWEPTPGATGYNIYKMVAGSGEEFELAMTLDAQANETFDTQVEGGVTYLYMAMAVVGGIETDPCGVVQATSNADPCRPALSVFALDGPAMQLQWTALAIADSYNVYRADAGSDEMQLIATTDASTQSYVDSEVEAGATYSYAVTVVIDGEERDPCGIVEATAIPSFPTAFGLVAAAGLGGVAYAAARRRKA